jgi:hypothetical protein
MNRKITRFARGAKWDPWLSAAAAAAAAAKLSPPKPQAARRSNSRRLFDRANVWQLPI